MARHFVKLLSSIFGAAILAFTAGSAFAAEGGSSFYSPEMLAALGALAKTWADSPEAQSVLDSARNSSHEEISAMVTTA